MYTWKYNVIINADGILSSKETYKYEFDEKGNWIKRINFINQIPKLIDEREYEYYETLTSEGYSQTTPLIKRGGIIVYEKNGHGLVVAPNDLNITNIAWAHATFLCANLALNGYSDWRLPTQKELNQLYLNKDKIGGFIHVEDLAEFVDAESSGIIFEII